MLISCSVVQMLQCFSYNSCCPVVKFLFQLVVVLLSSSANKLCVALLLCVCVSLCCCVDQPVESLPVCFSQRDEHLIHAVEFLSIFHPEDIGIRDAENRTAEPRGVPLRHRLIGRMLRENHTCRRRRKLISSVISPKVIYS